MWSVVDRNIVTWRMTVLSEQLRTADMGLSFILYTGEGYLLAIRN